MKFLLENGRTIPKEDKIFAINGRAKAMIAEKGKDAVINATIGALLDDAGDLIVMKSVVDAIRNLKPEDYAEYAPISGIPAFKDAVKKALFGEFETRRYVEVCATPGGTGAIRNTVSNYTAFGDTVLTADWFWAPYKSICAEIGRKHTTFEMFTEDGQFNVKDLAEKTRGLVEKQGRALVILNTPAHNPTGYSLTREDWKQVVDAFNEISTKGPIIILIDAAYIDFAGDEAEYRLFFNEVEGFGPGVLPLVAYSASKTLTVYGMRCGALVSMAADEETAEGFRRAAEFSSRATWSNMNRSAQTVMANIYADPALLKQVTEERAGFRDMLIRRGLVFEKALRSRGIENVPFDAGFFTCIACDDPDAVSAELEKKSVFVVPLAKGIRISVASISEEKCVRAAEAIADVMK